MMAILQEKFNIGEYIDNFNELHQNNYFLPKYSIIHSWDEKTGKDTPYLAIPLPIDENNFEHCNIGLIDNLDDLFLILKNFYEVKNNEI